MALAALAACLSADMAFAAAPSSRAGETKSQSEIVEEETMAQFVNGQKVGYVRTVTTRKGDALRTLARGVIEVSRLGTPIKVTVTQEFRETASGEPVSLRMEQRMAMVAVTIEGRFRGGQLELRSRTMGQERTRTEDWPAGARFGYALELYVREQIRRPVKEFSFTTYSAELDKMVTVTYEKVGQEDLDVDGRTVRVTKSLIHGLLPGSPPVEYRDSDGRSWKQVTSAMGMTVEAVRTTREAAEERPARPAELDINLDTSVPVRTRIARQFEVDAARYRLRLTRGRASDLSLKGPGQRVEKVEDDGSVVLSVRSVRPDPERVLARPIRDPEMAKCLEPSTFVQSDDPELAEAARAAVRDVRSSLIAAKRLELWVMRNMKDRGLDRAFASAKEVFRDRAGDCSEHAVLLCAMLRAVGVPARVAVGLLYAELAPGRPAFYYHMWTEGYVGEWVPFDATLAGQVVDATHIRLGGTELAGMSPAAGLLELHQLTGNLEIEVLEYSIGGRRIEPSAGPTRAVAETRCRVPDYGASCAVPDGWEAVGAGDGRLSDKRARCGLVRRGGKEIIELVAAAVPPGLVLSEALARSGLGAAPGIRREASLGGLPAVRMTKAAGPAGGYDLVAALKEGTLYMLVLRGDTEEGARALEAVAESFRFE